MRNQTEERRVGPSVQNPASGDSAFPELMAESGRSLESADYWDFAITGSLIQSYMVCPRQAWLGSRQVCPDEDNVYLQIGRLIQKESYREDRRELRLGSLAIDVVRRQQGHVVIAEVKKSSRARDAALMQLAFYLSELKAGGVAASGILLYPEEREREPVELTADLEAKIAKLKTDAGRLLAQRRPPAPTRTKFCGKCAYAEMCWA